MAIVRTDIAESLKYGVKAGFFEAREGFQAQRRAFAQEVPSSGEKEEYVGLGDHPMPRQFTDEISPKDLSEQSISIKNLDWEVSIEVEDNAINDDRVGHVLEWARSSGESYEVHMDKRAFQTLNGGDGTTYGLCYDGQNFFSNSHADTGAGAEYTTAQDNLYDLSLNPTNFDTVYVAMLNFLDGRGEPVGVVPDLLIHSPALLDMATQICQNRDKAETANRNVNPFAGKVTPLMAPYLDSTAWILVASARRNKPVLFQMRQQPELEIIRKGERKMTIYSWVARYNTGFGNWRLAIMGKT